MGVGLGTNRGLDVKCCDHDVEVGGLSIMCGVFDIHAGGLDIDRGFFDVEGFRH